MKHIYDVVVVGGGLAGLSAGWVLSMHDVDFLIVSEQIGGKILDAALVTLYPFVQMSGKEMIKWLLERIPDDRIVQDKILRIEMGSVRRLVGKENEYYTRGLILATGGKRREFKFKVPYKTCILCEYPFCKDKSVCIVYEVPYYLSSLSILRKVAKRVDVYHISRVLDIKYDEHSRKYTVVSPTGSREYDLLFWIGGAKSEIDIEGLPDPLKVNVRFKFAPLAYLAGDVLPNLSFAIFAVATGIISALNLLNELHLYRLLAQAYSEGEDLPSGNGIPEIASEKELERIIREHDVALIVWHSQYCGPCMVYESVLEKLARRHKLPVFLVDCEKIEPRRYGIRALPTSICYVHGEEKWRREGIISYRELLEMVEKVVERKVKL